MKTDDIRKAFLEFFKSKGHEIVPSDSLVPKDDPTLLFTGAGMNQFKEKFLGRNITYRRAASSQKCLRTGDLENVGRTPRHHTFFEMLGNFSFGDYFKKEAIIWAWEFFTKVLNVNPDKLWVSAYKDDEEAYNIWKDDIKVPLTRIIKLGEKDNFWPSEAPTKGPNGPCGPCSEIFYDYGPEVGCKKADCAPECDCGRFVEIWNLVFTQFDRQPDGSLKPLPNKNIDTGMGLERIASVMQNVRTNFEIDIFVPIIKAISSYSVQRTAYSVDAVRSTQYAQRINAIADHIRAATFAISDGVMPSNEERGYVARKLIRRASSRGQDIGIKEPFLYKLVSIVAEVMKPQYPEIIERRDDIAQVVKREEENFLSVIAVQLPKVEGSFEELSRDKDSDKLARAAFNFYDTYGMPYDMLEDVAEKFNLKIDKKLFDGLLEKQRELSRSGTKIKGEIFSETFAKKIEALGLKTEFLGYEKVCTEAKVLAVLDSGEVILDKTPFYGESGGQAGDWGSIETKSGAMEVLDAKRIGETIVHIGRMLRGKIEKGETIKVSIDEDVRKRIMRNHTATHLLQAALRKVLGGHVHQMGSLVDQDHLRFDFTHMKKMDEREITRVEDMVNEDINRAISVKSQIKSLESAKKEGAMALFGEKYSDRVRVVSIGNISNELCGGTHIDNTKDIEYFKITGESSIASGIRRIEALTANTARGWVEKQKEIEDKKLETESKKEEYKKLLNARLNEEIAKIDSLITKGSTCGGTKIITEIIQNLSVDGLKILSDKIRSKTPSALIILAVKDEEKASFIISLTEDLVKMGLSAGDLAKELAEFLDGSGGGRPEFARGGGKNVIGLEKALGKITEIIKNRL
ncbi:MAG: alanine--tRNA ligase [Candidatus Omnitrophota bacterium]|nr:alanine--tRNA ligase [Candidatus Omnitrophota bacterium]